MKTAVTYARFSSARQHETSIEAQRDAMAKWCSQRGVQIVQEYADRAASGTKTEGRDDFLQMLADLKRRRVDYVLVHKYDRFARNENDQYFYMAMIEQRGAKLVAVAQEFGDGPEARFMLGVITAYNAFYSANLGNEVKKGRAIIIQQGKHPGGPIPLGYVSDGNGSYMIDDFEAYYMRRLFRAVINRRESTQAIIAEMNDVGIHGRRGGDVSYDTVARLLRNPIYAGVYQRHLPNGEIYRIENHHPAIVSMAEFEEVQRIMSQRTNVGRPNKTTFLLTGIAYCGACGSKIYAVNNPQNGKPYSTYFCTHCSGFRRIPAAELEGAAVDYLNALFSPERRAQLADAVASYSRRLTQSAQKRQPSAEREIKKIQREIDALVANLATGALDADTVAVVGQQISTRRARIKVLQESVTPPAPVNAPDVAEYFAGVSSLSLDMDRKVLRQIMHRYIARVIVHTTEIEFQSTFEDWFAEQKKKLQIPTNGPTNAVIYTISFLHRAPGGGRGASTRIVPKILISMDKMHKVKRHPGKR